MAGTLILLVLAAIGGTALGVILHDPIVDFFKFGPDGRPENYDVSYENLSEGELRSIAQKLKIIGHTELEHADLLVAIREVI